MKKTNRIIVATAVAGGVLAAAPGAMAQTTYSGGTATVTTTTTASGATQTQISNVSGSPIVPISGSQTNSSTVVGAASGTTVTTSTTATFTAPLTVSSGQTAPLSSIPSSGTAVTLTSTGVTVAPSATSTVPVTLTSTSNPVPVTVAPTAGVTVPVTGTSPTAVTVGTAGSNSAGTVVAQGTLSAPSVTVSTGTLNTGTASAPATIQITSSTGLIVSSGATLRGAGTIVGSNNAGIQIAGVLRPGNSPGVLTVQNAPITLTSASTLGIDIDGTTTGNGSGKYSQVKGTGTTSFYANGLLTPSLGSDVSYASTEAPSSGYKNPAIGTSYTIVTTDAANGVGGQFTGLGTDAGRRVLGTGTSAAMLSNTTFDVVYNSNSIVLYVTPSKYQNLGQSGISLSNNQTASAGALQDLRMANKPLGVERIANSDLKSLFDNLAPQSAGSLQNVYDQISGASIATLGTQSVRTANVITDAFTARASHGRTLAQTGIAGGSKGGLSGGDKDGGDLGDRGWSAWAQPIGQLGDIDSDGNGPGYSHSTVGGLAGFEGRVRNAVFGIGYGYARDDLDFNSFSNKTKVDNHVVTAYGEYSFGRAFLNGTVGYTWKDFEETRNIAIGNYSKTATGKTDGSNFNVSATAGYTFTPATFIVEPSVGLRYNSFHLNGFTETGADSLNLQVSDQDFDSLQSLISVRIARPFTLASGTKLVPEARVGWQHEIMGSKSSVATNFTSGASRFSSTAAQAGDDAALIGLGLKAQLTGKLDVFTDYNARIGSGQADHGITAGVKYKF